MLFDIYPLQKEIISEAIEIQKDLSGILKDNDERTL